MKLLIAALCIPCLLLLVSPAHPQTLNTPFTASSTVDWGALTWSGVTVQITPQVQFQDVALGSHLDGFQTHAFTPDSWVSGTTTVALPSGDSVSAVSDASQLSSTFSLTHSLTVLSEVERAGMVRAMQSGSLTLSVPYTMAYHVDASSSLSTAGNLGSQLVLGNGVVHSGAPLTFHAEDFQQSGVLSMTQIVRAGDSIGFDLRTQVQTVPIPDTFWALLMGLLGAAWMVRRARINGTS